MKTLNILTDTIPAGTKVILYTKRTALEKSRCNSIESEMDTYFDGKTVVTVAEELPAGEEQILIEETKDHNYHYCRAWVKKVVSVPGSPTPADMPFGKVVTVKGGIRRVPQGDPGYEFNIEEDADTDAYWYYTNWITECVEDYYIAGEMLSEECGFHKFYAGYLGTKGEGCGNTELHTYRVVVTDADAIDMEDIDYTINEVKDELYSLPDMSKDIILGIVG